MKKNRNSGHASEKFCGNLLINKHEYFHLCFIESLTFIQFSSNVYIWEEQEYCNDGDLLFYNCGCMLLEKGKECKERYEFGKKDRFLENQILSSFSLNLLVGNAEHLNSFSFLGGQHSCATKSINWYGDSI